MHLGCVAFNAMRRIKQFAACGNRFGRRLRSSQTRSGRERDKTHQRCEPCGVRAAVSSNGGNVVHTFMVGPGCVCILIWIMRKLFLSIAIFFGVLTLKIGNCETRPLPTGTVTTFQPFLACLTHPGFTLRAQGDRRNAGLRASPGCAYRRSFAAT